MKHLLFALIAVFSLSTFAGQKMDMSCVTEYPTTSFFIREVDSTVIVEVFHHNGTGYMPIFEGLLTPNDVDNIAQKASIIKKLPATQRFEWPREKCEVQDTMVQSCFGPTEIQDQNGFKVKSWGFYSTYNSEKSFIGKTNTYRLTLDLSIDGTSYSMPMKYNANECAPEAYSSVKPRK